MDVFSKVNPLLRGVKNCLTFGDTWDIVDPLSRLSFTCGEWSRLICPLPDCIGHRPLEMGRRTVFKIPELTVQQNPSYLVKLIPKSQTSGGPYIGGGVNNNEQFVIV